MEVTHMCANVDHQMLFHFRAGKAKPTRSWRLRRLARLLSMRGLVIPACG